MLTGESRAVQLISQGRLQSFSAQRRRPKSRYEPLAHLRRSVSVDWPGGYVSGRLRRMTA